METNGLDFSASSYTSDKALQPFQADHFDPADFLNSALPPWNTASTKQASTASLAEISNQTQTLLSQLNAQLTRLSSTLTQLTDDILRSGGRLAYEVEVLRGDTTALTDTLTDGLRDDFQKLLTFTSNTDILVNHTNNDAEALSPSAETATNGHAIPQKPDYITRLQTLSLVRARLETVMKVFSDAIDWVLPPSETASQSSLIGISAPESAADTQTREVKGREFVERVRDEILELVEAGPSQDPEEALAAAESRVEALRELATVWKGTVEERPRMKLVEGLAKIVQERRR